LLNDSEESNEGISASNKFLAFVEKMIDRSRIASQGRYSDNERLPPLSTVAIQLIECLTVLFTCLMNSEKAFP